MAMWIPQRLQHTTLLSCYDKKMAKMFGQREYKWGYVNRSFETFGCILHDFLIANLTAYGFDYQSLIIMKSFFPIDNKEQKLIMSSVVTLKFYVEFHKGQFRSITFQYLYL